jgi:Zn-dependent protease
MINKIQLIAVSIIPLVFAITLHEAAHGWMANRLGDGTAKMMGRLSINPLRHIDPVGTVLVPMIMFLLGGFIFGWAKPVPVNTRNFKDPRKDMAAVAVAGPMSNLLMALAWAIVWKLTYFLPESMLWAAVPLALMGQIGVLFNLILMVLNLLPIPPLDGSRVLAWLVPPRIASQLDRMEPFGIFIILALLFLGLWQFVISPATSWIGNLIMHLVNLPT